MRLTNRIQLLSFLCAVPVAAFAQHVPLQQPPVTLPADASQLTPLLSDAAGHEIRSRSAWKKQRKVIRREWLDFLGGLPAKKSPLEPKVLDAKHLDSFSRQHVQYQIEDGVLTDGYLLSPKSAKGKLPAVVVFHPTTPIHAKGVAGLDTRYEAEKWQGVQLVQRGYVVWCPRNYINADGADWAGNARRVREAHPNWTGMTRMVWDAIRAVDFVESLPMVDKKRIGCLGHSLGGKQALFAAAFDGRIKAAVSSEGGIGLKFSNWKAAWYLGPGIDRPGFELENHQVLALVAPRAFLLLAGDSADGDRSWVFIDAVMPVYGLLGAPEKLGWFNHHLGHRYAPEARKVAEEFLDRQLKK